MRLRTFTAPDMPAAIELVRRALGEDAIIIASDRLNGKTITVTAAVEEEEEIFQAQPLNGNASYRAESHDSDADAIRFEMQNALRFHNLPELFLARLMQKAADADLASIMALHRVGGGGAQNLHRLAMEKLLAACYRFEPLEFTSGARVLIAGPHGAGKTLTVAKLAARLAMDRAPLTVIAADNRRAGGVEQLAAFTGILGIELKTADSPAALRRRLDEMPPGTRALIDSAGCNPFNAAEFEELQELAAQDRVETVLALPAGGDSLEAIDMLEQFAALPLRRLIVTRADSARRFGNVLAAAAAHNLAFANVGASASVVDTPQPFDAALLARLLLRYQLQSS